MFGVKCSGARSVAGVPGPSIDWVLGCRAPCSPHYHPQRQRPFVNPHSSTCKKMSPQVTTYTSSIRTQLAPSTASTPGTATSSEPAAAGAATSATSTSVKNEDDDAGKKKKTVKRRKVNHACLYCRRSHMTCDEGRPCQRWRVLKNCL